MKELKTKKTAPKAAKTAKKAAPAVVKKEAEEAKTEAKVCKCECGCDCGCDCKCGCKCCCKKKLLLDCYLDVLANYVTFNGRLSRRGYWGYVLFNFIFANACLLFDFATGAKGIIFLTYSLLTLLPAFAAMIRRLHDINRNMWWCLVPMLVAPVLTLALRPVAMPLAAYIKFDITLLVSAVSLVLSFVLLFLLMRKGDEKENRYGEPEC